MLRHPSLFWHIRSFLGVGVGISISAVALVACGGGVQSSDTRDGGGAAQSVGSSGGTTGTSGGSKGVSGSGGTTGTSGNTTGTDGTLEARCPSNVPPDGSSCSSGAHVACEYGGQGPHLECSTIASCSADGKWFVRTPEASCNGLQANNAPSCPAAYGSLEAGAACPANVTGSCVYPEGVCECASCFPSAGTTMDAPRGWSCRRWPEPAGCPTPRPRAGSACTSEGLDCDYTTACSAVSLGLPDVKCIAGVWQEQDHPALPCEFPTCSQ